MRNVAASFLYFIWVNIYFIQKNVFFLLIILVLINYNNPVLNIPTIHQRFTNGFTNANHSSRLVST